MASQPPHISLDELSKKISQVIIRNFASFMDSNTIGNAAMAHMVTVDTSGVDNEDLGDAISESIDYAISEETIEEYITTTLK